jgi:hypothetical protein
VLALSGTPGRNGQITDYLLGIIDDLPEGKGRAFRDGTRVAAVFRASRLGHARFSTQPTTLPKSIPPGYSRPVRAEGLES